MRLFESLESRHLLAVTVPGDLDLGYGALGHARTGFIGQTDDVVDAVVNLGGPYDRFLVASNSWYGEARINLTRYLGSGALDTSFGFYAGIGSSGTISYPTLAWRGVADMVAGADGKITLLASQPAAGAPVVQRIQSDGALDPTWVGPGSGITGKPAALAALADGKTLVATGTMLARLNVDGTLDGSFGTGGKVIFPTPFPLGFPAYGVAVQADGAILIAGEKLNIGQAQRQALVRRFTAGGALDTTFGSGGLALLSGVSTTASSLRDIKVQADGAIVVAGYSGDDSIVARLTPQGVMDSTFGIAGVRTVAASTTHVDKAYQLELDPSGAIVVSGSVELENNAFDEVYGPYIARLTSAGAIDSGFDGNGVLEHPQPVTDYRLGRGAIFVNGTGQIVFAGGSAPDYNSDTDIAVARFSSNGSLDTTFRSGGFSRNTTLRARQMPRIGRSAIQPDGKLIQIGSAYHVPGAVVVHRLNVNGTPDATFGTGGTVEIDLAARSVFVHDVIVQANGKILLVGRADSINPADGYRWETHLLLIRLNANGTRDTGFGDQGVVRASALDGGYGQELTRVAVLADGRIMASGRQSSVPVVLRFLADGQPDLTYGNAGTAVLDVPGSDERITSTSASGSGVVVAGDVISGAGNYDRFVARLDESGQLDTAFGGAGAGGRVIFDSGAMNEAVLALVPGGDAGGGFYIGGNSSDGALLTKLTAGGVVDATFGVAGTATVPYGLAGDAFNDVIRTPDGNFVFAGLRTISGTGERDALVMRATAAGALDTTFGTAGIKAIDLGSAQDVGIGVHAGPNNRIVIAGVRGTGTQREWTATRLLGRSYTTLDIHSRDYRFTPDTVIHLMFAGNQIAGSDASDLVAYNVTTGQRFQTWDYYETLTNPSATVVDFMRSDELPAGKYAVTIPADALSDGSGPLLFEMYIDRGTAGNEVFTIKQEGPAMRITREPADGTTGATVTDTLNVIWNSAIYLNGASGDDTVTVDYTSGKLAGAWLDLNGGAGSADKYVVMGNDSATPPRTVGLTSSRGFERLGLGSGQFRLASSLPTGSGLEILPGASVLIDATQLLSSVYIAGAASMKAGGAALMRATSLQITEAGTLDLADNDLIVDYASVSPVGIWTGDAYDGIAGYVQSGRIKSSAASGNLKKLGVAESREALGITGTQTGTFSGQAVDSTAVLVKFTWGGDANLDGKLNIDDYGRIDSNVAQSGSVWGWFNGDFNYDGLINIDDYGIIDGNMSQQDIVL